MTLNAHTARHRAIAAELDRALAEYETSRQAFEEANVRYVAAKERLAHLRDMAKGIMSMGELYEWNTKHLTVKYLGAPIGEAILDVLQDHAMDAAMNFVDGKAKAFKPELPIQEIRNHLEEGGFEFRSMTPLREINATLIKLTGAEKRGRGYAIVDADNLTEIFQEADETAQRRTAQEQPTEDTPPNFSGEEEMPEDIQWLDEEIPGDVPILAQPDDAAS